MDVETKKAANWGKEAEKVCHDFDVFCDYLLERKASLTKATGHIGKKDCFELNRQLSVKEGFERPTRLQKDYPVINFFYYVAIKHRILEPDSSGCNMQPGQNYGYYKEAEALEKFLLMLADVLFDGRFNGNELWFGINVASFMEWAVKIMPCANQVYCLPKEILMGYDLGRRDCLMTYLEELGVLKIHKEAGMEDGRVTHPWEADVGPLFELAYDLYRTVYDSHDCGQEEPPVFSLSTYWETHISGGKASGLIKILEEPDMDYKNQVVDLEIKVRHGKCIRIVRMNLSDSLYELHLAIQEAFEFDNDHLFAFYAGYGMLKETFTIPEASISGDEYSVYETLLGDLQLRAGDKFSYLFDFGDEWWFDIKAVAIKEGSVHGPEHIKAVHDAPEQYPVYEDEYEDDM